MGKKRKNNIIKKRKKKKKERKKVIFNLQLKMCGLKETAGLIYVLISTSETNLWKLTPS